MNVPQELADRKQWCLWRDEDGRKVPYQPSGLHAKTNDPATWSTLAECQAVADQFSGLGYVFSADDPYAGIDLDGVWRDGEIAPWAAPVLESLADGYQEISPSGRGVKVWCRARVPDGRGRKVQVADGQGIEVYDRGRYFAFTGRTLDETRQTIGDCQTAVDAILARFWPAPAASHPAPVSSLSGDVPARAAKYLERVSPAVSGHGGHGQTIRVAAILVRGFSLSVESALQVIQPWNARCQPPWSEKELRHKLTDADKRDGERGWLLNGRTYSGPDVELGRLLASLAGGDEVASERPDDVPDSPLRFPSDCLSPPGLLSEIIGYNLRTALWPQQELALAGALALLGTITGRKVQDQRRTRTNVYCLGLAASGAGKEYARTVNKEILLRAGGEKMLGPEGIASSAGMVQFINSQRSILFQLDEIGRLLETMRDPKRAPHLFKIGSELMKLDSCANTLYKGDAYANQKQSVVINQPHCCIYGTSVPRGFWESLTDDNVSEGLLGRMLVFEAGSRYVGIAAPKHEDPPESILAGVRWWIDRPYGPGDVAEQNPSPVIVPYSKAAKQRLDDHMLGICSRRDKEDDTKAALWSRATGKTAKLALLLACSRCTGTSLIAVELEDVDRAVKISNWLTRRMLYQAYRHVSSNDYERSHKRILRLIGDGIDRSALTRKTQWLRRREREEILSELIESGEIVAVSEDTGGKVHKVRFLPRKQP